MNPLEKKQHMERMIADARARLAAMQPPMTTLDQLDVDNDLSVKTTVIDPIIETIKPPQEIANANKEKALKEIQGLTWNEAQTEALTRAESLESFCLIGKAGTGKTTVTREIIKRLIEQGKISPLDTGTKHVSEGSPGVVIVSFTNRAVKNIAKGMSKDLQRNALTVHKLLEFEPEFYDIVDASGNAFKKMRFAPRRNKYNPLPSSLKCIIFEESSMISVELYHQLIEALPHECQFIFLGDLQQLPPVYGSAILGFKLLELPVVELTEIYRQAADSPIISLAWRISSGQTIPASEFDSLKVTGKLQIRPWKKKLSDEDALHITSKLFAQFIDQGVYNPDEDMVMIPFNKRFGTDEFNRNMAQHLGVKRGAEVFEIIAGFTKHYYAVGDKVLVEKQEAIIREIVKNGRYQGVPPLPSNTILNRWGVYNLDHPDAAQFVDEDPEEALAKIENFMNGQLARDDDEEVKQQASHIIKCQILGSEEYVECSTSGDYSSAGFSYALTVHKCQGSEWRKCFLLVHKSHGVMLNRELLYTACTRARESLYIICEPDSLEKGVSTQRIKGNTIAEKAEYFKGKVEETFGTGRRK